MHQTQRRTGSYQRFVSGDGKGGWELFTATDADAIYVVTNLIGTKVR